MTYLRNTWYPAAWSETLIDKPLGRMLLDDPIVLFRDSSGRVCTLYDTCPHRFAPLSLGKVKDGVLACAYHGLEFDSVGRCVRNPHGEGAIPKGLGVRAYPTVERYGMIWVWSGDADKADESLLPLLPSFEDEQYSWIRGELEVSANYGLVIDNLMDLSHVEFLHPFLAAAGGSVRTTFRVSRDGNNILAHYQTDNEPITGLFQLLWDSDEKIGTLNVDMQWQPPTHLSQDTVMTANGVPRASAPSIPVVHLLMPESQDSTRYFWAAGRNRAHGDEKLSGMLRFGTQNAFENEDEPMIKAVRGRMQSNDLLAHNPAILHTDGAGIQARRTLAKLIKAEQQGD